MSFIRRLALAVFCLAMVPASLSAQGTADYVTGSYTVVIGAQEYYAEIDAKEASATEPAGGSFYWVGERFGQEYYLEGSVTDVEISGNIATVHVTLDTVTNTTHIQPGWTFVYQVVDGGTPGVNGDTMQLTYLTGSTAAWGPVPLTSGDLEVVETAASPREIIQEVNDCLAGYVADNSQAQQKIDKARNELSMSLAEEYWTNKYEPSGKGNKVFNALEKAVEELAKITGPDEAAVIAKADELVAQSRLMAQAKLDAAILANGDAKDIEDALEEIAEGDEESKLDKAVLHFGQAFKDAYQSTE